MGTQAMKIMWRTSVYRTLILVMVGESLKLGCRCVVLALLRFGNVRIRWRREMRRRPDMRGQRWRPEMRRRPDMTESRAPARGAVFRPLS